MSEFQLDTSGEVGSMPGARYGSPGCVIDSAKQFFRWPDLSSFVQGYVEAMFQDIVTMDETPLCKDGTGWRYPGFSDLAPETLARIMEDCAARLRSPDCVLNSADGGRSFWLLRQAGQRPGFPPLTLALGDDGKVRFR